MLVLSRKKNESLVVGDAEITVVEIRGDKVRLGIVAPKEVPVHEKEVWEEILAQPSRWEKLLPVLQAQYEDRRKHGLSWRDPAELRDMRLFLPLDATEPGRLLLHVDPAVTTDQLAHAYGMPAPFPGPVHTMSWRPERPYLLFLNRKSLTEVGDPAVALESALLGTPCGFGASLLPLEVTLLAIEQPDVCAQGCTAAGAAYGAEPPLKAVIEDPEGKELYDREKTLAVCRNAYVISLLRRPEGTWGWVVHQGALGTCVCPTISRVH